MHYLYAPCYDYIMQKNEQQDLGHFVPACNGTETWTQYQNGKEYLYVWNNVTGETGWLCRGDIVHFEHPNDMMAKAKA